MINSYTARQVSSKDAQSCIVCHRLTQVCLFNESGPDWFYSCALHLEDNPLFATPVYSEEYVKSLGEIRRLKQQINILTTNYSGSWEGWVTKMFNKKAKDETNDNDKDTIATKGTEESAPEATGDPANELNNLKSKCDNLLNTISQLRKKNKNYKLSDSMFLSRVENKKRQERLLEQRKVEEQSYTNTDPDEITQNFSFPTVPKDLK